MTNSYDSKNIQEKCEKVCNGIWTNNKRRIPVVPEFLLLYFIDISYFGSTNKNNKVC